MQDRDCRIWVTKGNDRGSETMAVHSLWSADTSASFMKANPAQCVTSRQVLGTCCRDKVGVRIGVLSGTASLMLCLDAPTDKQTNQPVARPDGRPDASVGQLDS